MERPTLDGMAWLHEALAHIVERVPALGIERAVPQTNGWERDGHVRVKAHRHNGLTGYYRIPVGAVNGHDTALVIRTLLAGATLEIADAPQMIMPVRITAPELTDTLMQESRWLNGFDGR